MLTKKEREQIGTSLEAISRRYEEGMSYSDMSSRIREGFTIVPLPDVYDILDTFTEEEKKRHVGGD